jgi:phosphoribosylformylglycinamidine synthase
LKIRVNGFFVVPRRDGNSLSTNAVEITQNMAISGIIRIEEFHNSTADEEDFDPMLSQKYAELNQTIFTIDIAPEAILDDICSIQQTRRIIFKSRRSGIPR